ncbi:unnamed protein product [Coffea canephora]|uniref:Aminoglycoside phosphotransferase domain-containing protein n=1 Tax=Coffea canephora TaxID=49390 RepID=A0A068TMD4_COFCA|nr:unnamed protein product [Coffea canephora]
MRVASEKATRIMSVFHYDSKICVDAVGFSGGIWISPYLDSDAEAVRQDNILKLEVAELKSKFCERTQALIHGDLHTGSIMVTSNSTQVTDPEFSFYVPMGFDGNDRKEYKLWILKTIEETWNLFYKKFTTLWDEHKDGPSEAYLPELYNNVEIHLLAKQKYMEDLFHDSLGFAAEKMTRRIVGVAHVEDFESIAEPEKRANCELQALTFAKLLLKERRRFKSIGEVVSAIQQSKS